jgi:glycyl-tRNA synthetase
LEVHKLLKPSVGCFYDDTGSIGKRYYRQDEIGTFACITVDHETLEKGTVTIRDRDTTKQERVKISDLAAKLKG